MKNKKAIKADGKLSVADVTKFLSVYLFSGILLFVLRIFLLILLWILCYWNTLSLLYEAAQEHFSFGPTIRTSPGHFEK